MSDEQTGKDSTSVNGWPYLCGCPFDSVLTIWCSSSLEDARDILLEGSFCQEHKFLGLVLCLSVQVLENS